jgi:type VI secretion system secreted protein VgrG
VCSSDLIIITDTKDKYIERKLPLHIRSKNMETTGIDPDRIEVIELESKIVPQKVTITNFGYEKAHLGDNGVISCTANISIDGNEDTSLFGEEVIYGENFINPEMSRGEEGEFGDGEFLAKIRAQEIFCSRRIYKARSTALPISAGMKVMINDDTNPVFNGEYLVLEVQHAGHMFRDEIETNNDNLRFYENTLVLIKADVQFRPSRQTPWPRIYGTMNALIDAEGEELLYPQLDSKGRYKIRLPFLKQAKEDGKGSIWMRLATPYAGDSYGFHFPLHKGTEVILSFRDGNPDLPVIMGAVFNSLHKNVVIDQNAYMGGVIMTKADNIFCMFDTKGAHSIGMATNNNWQQLQ